MYKIGLALLDVFDEKSCVMLEDQEIFLEYQSLCKWGSYGWSEIWASKKKAKMQ